jgi:hypothetical protein
MVTLGKRWIVGIASVVAMTACTTLPEPVATETLPPAGLAPTVIDTVTPTAIPTGRTLTPSGPEPEGTLTLTPAPSATPASQLSRDGVRSILVTRLISEVLGIRVPYPKVKVGTLIEEWDIFSLYWGAGIWEVSGPGLHDSGDWTPGLWWVIEDSGTIAPADAPARALASYLAEYKLVRPAPTPTPTPTPTPSPTPEPICDFATGIKAVQILGTMNDPLMLRADIDAVLRNNCTIPVTANVVGVVLGENGTVLGRQAHFRAEVLEPGTVTPVSILVLGNFVAEGEFEYRVEVSPADSGD